MILTTGTDEHGQKIERAALAAGKTPQAYTDVIADEFQRQWQILGLSVDRFQRTTSKSHAAVVQDLFRRCVERGYVYKGHYTGQYCVFDELYVNDAKPGDPCRNAAALQKPSRKKITFSAWRVFKKSFWPSTEAQPDFILPETRRNEVLLRQTRPSGSID